MQTIIFLNGKIPRDQIVQEFTEQKGFIIAADGGANYLRKIDILPRIIIGDLDSISKPALDHFKKKKVKIEMIDDQDTTDFEKCLKFCLSRKLNDIIVFGGTSIRSDHTLNNFSVLKRYSDRLRIKLIDDEFEIFFVNKKINFDYLPGKTVSFLGLPKAINVTSRGLEYLLSDEDLEFGVREGTLNRSVSDSVSITFESGSLLLFKKHFIK